MCIAKEILNCVCSTISSNVREVIARTTHNSRRISISYKYINSRYNQLLTREI